MVLFCDFFRSPKELALQNDENSGFPEVFKFSSEKGKRIRKEHSWKIRYLQEIADAFLWILATTFAAKVGG